MSDKPLEGLRVLDLTRLLPGPMCTLHLADMGADVIKIEDMGRGDYTRDLGSSDELDLTSLFDLINRNKRSLRLDLSQPEGVGVFLDLAASADAVVEGFQPGVVVRLGIGYQAVRKRNPRIVYCSISGYGQTGPLRDRPGHDVNYCGYAGVIEQIGVAGGAPAIPNFQIADLAGGALSGAMGILAALVSVKRNGKGRYVDVAMTDCTLAHTVVSLARSQDSRGSRPRGEDTLSGGLACYGVYETSDGGFMALGALEAKFWKNFCDAVGRSDLVGVQFAAGEEGAAVRAEVAAIFKSATRLEWTEKLSHLDCCVSPLLNVSEALENAHFRERGMFVTVDRDGEPQLQFALPVRFSDYEFSVERTAPQRGEHGEEVLKEIGYSAKRIRELKQQNII